MIAKAPAQPQGKTLEQELSVLAQILKNLGYSLEEEQLHIKGERYLMSPTKLVLTGRNPQDERVVIKASRTAHGKTEMRHEKKVRDLLVRLSFANDTLHAPRELYFGEHQEYLFFITNFIEQPRVFVAHSLEEQFFLTLRAFEAQETFHASTYEHLKEIKDVFSSASVADYLTDFASFKKEIIDHIQDERLSGILQKGEEFLREHRDTLERYTRHLTHTDFVPHNMRVQERVIYLLDHTALRFANKHEGWARFLNYMIVHNPQLEKLLVEHLRRTRGADEYLSLRLMRVYKIGFLLRYYARALEQTAGDLAELMKARIVLWAQALEYILADKDIPKEMVDIYTEKRNILRSEEEKKRQREFAVA